MSKFKRFVLTAGAALIALSSVAVTFNGFSAHYWNLIAAPVFVALAGSFWKLAKAT